MIDERLFQAMWALFLFGAVTIWAGENKSDKAPAPRGGVDLKHKLNRLIIDHMEFEDASVAEVIEFFRRESKRIDPDGIGVNILVLGKDKAKTIPSITLAFNKIPLGEAIRYVCQAANLKHRVDKHAVVIAMPGASLNRTMRTKAFKVKPSTIMKTIKTE